ncbi:MAG: hypothetical protein COA78_31955 [Blastopirellula sp.]|nr:MAG: hypothetical protein COA78_31955 [Blastopirellula sp.]
MDYGLLLLSCYFMLALGFQVGLMFYVMNMNFPKNSGHANKSVKEPNISMNNSPLNKRELVFLSSVIMFLAVANIVNLIFEKPFWPITQIIYLGYDNNLPAWYSSMLFVVAGLISYECWVFANKNKIQGRVALLFFTLLLFLMSADEIVQIHEHVGRYVPSIIDLSSKDFAKHTGWVYVGGPLVIAIFIGFMFLLKRILTLVPGAMLYLAIGFSLIVLGGIVLESSINFLNHEELQWLWDIEVVAEETMEMLGTIFIAYALIIWRDGAVHFCYPSVKKS